MDLPVWMTREALSEINQRDNTEKLARRMGTDEDWVRYRRLRNKVIDFKRSLKRTYFEIALAEAGTDSRKLWKLIRQLPGTGKRRNIMDRIYESSELVEMANSINQFFVDIGPKLA